AHPGPSPAGEWTIRGSGRIARTTRNILGNGKPGIRHARPSTSRTTPRVSKQFPNRPAAGARRTSPNPKTPARQGDPPASQSPLTDSNRRPLPYHGTTQGSLRAQEGISGQQKTWYLSPSRQRALPTV